MQRKVLSGYPIKKDKCLSLFIWTFFIFVISLNGNFLFTQEKPQKEVTVMVVEVPVRVLLKGRPVKNLIKEDFEVYENGVKQDITHFEIISRKIAAHEMPTVLEEKPKPKKRLFILIFDIFDYEDSVGEGIDYFFSNIYQPGDQIVVLTEDQILTIERGKTTDDLVHNLKKSLKKYKQISTQNILQVFRELRYEADRLIGNKSEFFVNLEFEDIMRFLENYRRAWEAYKSRYLVPDLAFYQALIIRIKAIEGDKWAICFQQRDIFPYIKSASRLDYNITAWISEQIEPEDQAKAQILQGRLQDLQRSFDLSSSVSPEALREIFLSADITFHLILLKSFRTLLDQDFELKEVAQDYEDSLRKISKATGGYLAFSNRIMEALKEAVELEDYHYLLVYSPEDSTYQKQRDIEVKVARSGVDVISLKHFVDLRIVPITISDFKAGDKAISFSLLHYQMAKIHDKVKGLAEVKITLFDERSNKVFDEGKSLDLIENETRISINFSQLKPGNYFIIIQAIDKLANLSDVFSGMIKL